MAIGLLKLRIVNLREDINQTYLWRYEAIGIIFM